MSQEKLLADFSGGMNALAAVDKLDPKECLLAENIRFDETGSIQSAGAYTHQNSVPYAAAGGTNTNNVHSLYWNPAIGAVAGVGQDVFIGPTLGGMSSKLAAKNASQQKMSFASSPNRVYFDVGNTGYWTDMNNLLTVDWPPPPSFVSIGGPTIVGTGTQVPSNGTATWTNPNNVTSVSTSAVASVNIGPGYANSYGLNATMGTNSFSVGGAVNGIGITILCSAAAPINMGPLNAILLKNNVPIGQVKFASPLTVFSTLSFGGIGDLWQTTWTAADVNNANFGVQFQISGNGGGIVSICNVVITIYGGSAGTVAAAGAAGALSGTYSWKVTFVAANGEESDGSGPTNSATLVNNQGTLTAISTGDARTVARNIYRKGNTLTSYYLVGTINDNSSTTYSDNLTDISALSAGTILAGDVPGDFPNSRLGANTMVRFPTLHYDRVFWVNQQKKNQLLWSKPLNGFAYPVVNFINVGDSSPITRTISIFGELIIFKSNSQIWRLTGTDESSFDLTQTPAAASTDESFTIIPLPDKILFHNRWGFWVFNGYTSQPLTTKLDLWMKQEDRTGKSLFGVNGFHSPEVVSQTVPLNFDATGNSEKFYFSYAEAGQLQNVALLVFDVKHGNITKREPGFPFPLSVAIDQVNGYVYMGDNLGFVSLLDDWNGANGGGTNVNFDFQHGYQDLQRGSNKALWALEFYLNTNGQTLTPTVYYDNGGTNEALAPITTTGLQRVVRTLESTTARKMQNFSVRLNGSLSKVNVNGTPQIQVVHVKVIWDLRAGRARTGQ